MKEQARHVKVITRDKEYEGILIESYDPNIILLKLDGGYNIGIEKKKVHKIQEISKEKIEEIPELKKSSKKLPGISIISTGGTIASRIDYKTGAVKWLMKPEQILALSPGLLEIAQINEIKSPFIIASENMHPSKWCEIAKIAAELLNKEENKGIIITHGTDTLHYTAAALSFMLKNLNKPVVMTYAQRSSDRGSSDMALNIKCSAFMALSDIAEVMLVGHATIEDDFCYALSGTKVRKMHSSRRDAFRPINTLPIAKIKENGNIEIIKDNFNKRDEKKKVIADAKFEERIALVKYYPGADSKIIDFYRDRGYKGLIIEATGLGHVGTEESNHNWIPSIKKAIDSGMIICFAPQTLYGRLNPNVYAPGRKLLEAGVIFLEDILPETAYVKLGYILAIEKNREKIIKLMQTNIANEFNPRLNEKDFMF